MIRRIALLGMILALLLSVPSMSLARVDRAPASTLVKAGSFVKRAGTGAQAVTGVGFRPKLLILFGVARDSEGFGDGYQYGFGASDGVTGGAISGWSWDGRGTLGSDADRRQAAKAITYVETIAGIEAEANLTSFNSDGFILNWTTNNASPWIINYLAVGGDAVEAKVSHFDANHESAGPKSYTHVGFRPDALLLFGAPSVYGPLEASFGFADAATRQFAMSVASQDSGANPTNTARYQRTDRVFASLDPYSSSIHVESEASLASMDTEGFTLDWATEAGPGQLISVAVKGVRARVGSAAEETYGRDVSYTGTGFEPRGGLFTGFNERPSATVVDINRFSIGVAGQDGGGASIWVSDQDDVVDDTRTDQATYGSGCYVGVRSGGWPSGYDMAASVKSWDADGFTLTWNGFSAAPAQLGYLLLGDAATPVGGIAEAPNDVASSGDSSARVYLFVIALTIGVVALMGNGWRVRRRRAG